MLPLLIMMWSIMTSSDYFFEGSTWGEAKRRRYRENERNSVSACARCYPKNQEGSKEFLNFKII